MGFRTILPQGRRGLDHKLLIHFSLSTIKTLDMLPHKGVRRHNERSYCPAWAVHSAGSCVEWRHLHFLCDRGELTGSGATWASSLRAQLSQYRRRNLCQKKDHMGKAGSPFSPHTAPGTMQLHTTPYMGQIARC